MRVSLKTIQQRFPHLDLETSQWMRAMLKQAGSYGWYSQDSGEWGRCSEFSLGEIYMRTFNEMLEGHGTEAIRGRWSNGYWCDIIAVYVNMGDTYNSTILYDREKRDFRITTFGDFVEQYGRKYGIE